MPQAFLAWCASVRAELEAISPVLPWATIALVCWLSCYVVRRWFPKQWLWLEMNGPEDARLSRLFLALPSVIIGAAIGATGGEVNTTVLGALVALAAPLAHHIAKALPGPYQGPVRDTVWRLARQKAAEHDAWQRALEAGGVNLEKGGDDVDR
jgi:hypothetical protein